MTRPEEICRETFTQGQLNKLLERSAWQALIPVAIEMQFDLTKMSTLNYDAHELRNMIVQTWRETASMLAQCRASYKKVRKENDKQRQIVMDFHLREKNQ